MRTVVRRTFEGLQDQGAPQQSTYCRADDHLAVPSRLQQPRGHGQDRSANHVAQRSRRAGDQDLTHLDAGAKTIAKPRKPIDIGVQGVDGTTGFERCTHGAQGVVLVR